MLDSTPVAAPVTPNEDALAAEEVEAEEDTRETEPCCPNTGEVEKPNVDTGISVTAMRHFSFALLRSGMFEVSYYVCLKVQQSIEDVRVQ